MGATRTRESSGSKRSSHRNRVCCFGVGCDPLDDGAGVARGVPVVEVLLDADAVGAGVVAASRADPRPSNAAGEGLGVADGVALGEGDALGDGEACGDGAADACTQS